MFVGQLGDRNIVVGCNLGSDLFDNGNFDRGLGICSNSINDVPSVVVNFRQMVADTVLPCGPVELARKHREGLGRHDDIVGKRWYDSEGRKFCWKRSRNQRQC